MYGVPLLCLSTGSILRRTAILKEARYSTDSSVDAINTIAINNKNYEEQISINEIDEMRYCLLRREENFSDHSHF